MRYKAIVKYNGARYYGWQKQDMLPTIQGEIERVISTIFNTPTLISGSGRTDGKVHALAQVFHFDGDYCAVSKLKYSLNQMLPPDIEIISLCKVGDDFHARHSAKTKHYQYIVRKNAKDPFSFQEKMLYHYPINEKVLKRSIKMFIGQHNFSNFTNRDDDEQNFIREITKAWVTTTADDLKFNFIGTGFMRGQVRIMVGTLIAINQGCETEDFIKDNLNPKARKIINYKVPGCGLYLVKVRY